MFDHILNFSDNTLYKDSVRLDPLIMQTCGFSCKFAHNLVFQPYDWTEWSQLWLVLNSENVAF